MFPKIGKTLSLFAICILALPLLVACSGGTSVVPSEVSATLKTFSLTLSSNTAKAGDVTFHVKNEATDLSHEFVVVRTELAANLLPLDANGNVDEGAADKLHKVDELEEIKTGKGGDLKVNLAPGHYVLMCNIAGHYKQGMHIDLTVVP
jgi:uncharacterized cupredoxin-like copper-binding protein